MESNQPNGKRKLKKLGEEVDEALRKATREALRKHKIAENPVAVWRDGKVAIVEPDKIVV